MTVFFTWLAYWFTDELYDFVVDTFSYFVQVMVLVSIETSINTIQFAWDVAQDIMEDVGVSAMISQMYSGFSGVALDLLLWFRIPEIVNTLTSAYVTRYVLSWIPRGNF